MRQPQYIAIDLKSFYASVECVDRGLDPMTTNLVVADAAPDGKDHLPGGVPLPEGLRHPRQGPPLRGGPKGAGGQRPAAAAKAPGRQIHRGFLRTTRTCAQDPALALDYLVAPPRMARYMDCEHPDLSRST